MSFNNPLLSNYPLLEPISSDSFVGQDARYMESFDTIEQAVSSSASLFTNTATDWANIVELSSKVLITQTKDIRLLSWFSWGLYKTYSFEGLHAGLFIINELLTKCWDDIFPVKKRSRIAAFEWLISRIEQLFMDDMPSIEPKQLHQAFLVELKRLDDFLTSHWNDESPLLIPTCRRIEKSLSDVEAHRTVSKESGVEGVVEKVITQTKGIVTSAVAPSSAIVSSVDNEKDASKLLRSLQDTSRSLCLWWLSQRSTDIKALRINRALLWITIESLPENKEGITALRPVPIDKINNYKERLSQGRYNDLINDVEMSISRAPFWLDGQYIVWQCMKALRMDDAMLEIEIQLALFLNRIPDLVTLKFHDATPFANDQTLAWINDSVLPKLKTTASQLTVGSSDGSGRAKWDDALQEGIDNLSTKGLKDSMAVLVAGLNMAEGGREKFFWRLCMAKLCLANNRYELAKTQLENLDEYIVQLNVAEWEPTLVLEVVYLLYRCCELLPQSQNIREDKERLYKRLCFLNMGLIMDEN